MLNRWDRPTMFGARWGAFAPMALAASLALVAQPSAWGAPTYAASASPYSWESAANIVPLGSFPQTCTEYPIDDDEVKIVFGGGFVFPMGGVGYTSARMLSNGQIQLGTDTGAFRSYLNTALPEGSSIPYAGCPGSMPTTNMISVGWTDLYPATGGSMSWEVKGAAPNLYVVISWNAIHFTSGAPTISMQAILSQYGSIKLQYKTVTGTTWANESVTVGVQLSLSDYTPWTAPLADSTAVLFTPGGVGGFSVVAASAAASTCGSTTATVKALTGTGAPYPGYTGTVLLSTSTGNGTWSPGSGSGVFVAGPPDSGAASYTYAPADMGSAVFTLADQHAQALSETAADGAATGTSAVVTFSKNSFVLAPSDALGFEVVAGRPHAFTASYYRQDPASGVCSVATAYAGAKSLDAWYVPTAAHPAGAADPGYSSSPSCAAPVALPSAAPAVNAASNNVSATFASGVAKFYLCTSDVGQFALGLRDDSLGFSSSPSVGFSGNATARPFGLWMDNVASGGAPNPGGTATSGSKFVAAQTVFSARVGARLWASGQDTAVAGSPDAGANLSSNALAAHFSAASTILAGGATPAAGALGALSGGAVPAASFSGGAATAAGLQYAEVGSARLTASSAGYLGSPYGVPGVASGPVGRFYPASFALSSGSVARACAVGGFTYMGQPFALVGQLNALGAFGGQLSNYDAARGYGFLSTPVWRAVDSADGVDRGGRLSTGGAPAWSGGVWLSASPGAVFARLPGGPDGAYDALAMGLSGADADGAAIASMDMSYSAAGACSGAGCNARAVGAPTSMRHGRLEVGSVFGSILPTLRVPLQALYWSRAPSGASRGWAPNVLDSCTSIPASSLSVGLYAGAVASVALPASAVVLSQGRGTVLARRTAGAAVSGSAVVGVDLGTTAAYVAGCAPGLPAAGAGAGLSHLASNFCSDSNYTLNPAGKATWGSSSSKSGSIVFMRETY